MAEAPATEPVDAAAIRSVHAPLRLGSTLARSVGFTVNHLPFLALVGGAVFLPLALYQLRVMGGWNDQVDRAEGVLLSALVLGVLYFLSPLMVQVFVTRAVFEHLRGDRPGVLASLRAGGRAFLPALGLAALVLGIMGLVLLLAGIPGGILEAATDHASWTGPVNALILLLAMLWVHCVYIVSPQVLVVERIGPWRALGRSRGLTRGSRWRLFVLLLLVLALYVGAGVGIRALLGPPESVAGYELRMLLQLAVAALLAAFAAVCAAVAYHDLRQLHDGVDVDTLIRVFE